MSWNFTVETKYLDNTDKEVHIRTLEQGKETRIASFYINKKTGRGYFQSDLIPFKIPLTKKQVKSLLLKFFNEK